MVVWENFIGAKGEVQMTNGDRIRQMTDDQLTEIIMCPYDTAGNAADIMPCIEEGNVQKLVSESECRSCCLNWLKREERMEKHSEPWWKLRILNTFLGSRE